MLLLSFGVKDREFFGMVKMSMHPDDCHSDRIPFYLIVDSCFDDAEYGKTRG